MQEFHCTNPINTNRGLVAKFLPIATKTSMYFPERKLLKQSSLHFRTELTQGDWARKTTRTLDENAQFLQRRHSLYRENQVNFKNMCVLLSFIRKCGAFFNFTIKGSISEYILVFYKLSELKCRSRLLVNIK